MLHISTRTKNTLESPIRKFLPKVLEREKQGIEVLKVNVGDPDIEVPEVFWQGLRSYTKKQLGYAPSIGIREHMEAWVHYFKNQSIELQTKNIIPTVGCAEAIMFALMAVADVGDEILVFEPLYTNYKGFATMAGITLVPVTLKIENDFALSSIEEIEKKITPKTKAILIINPNNPSGAVLSKEEMKCLVECVLKHDLFLIADETYREIVFSGKPKSFLEFFNVRQNLLVLDSLSKKFSCPGARIGCIVSLNEDIMKGILRLAMIRLSAPTLEQYASVTMLDDSKTIIDNIVREYKGRRDVVASALKKIPGVVTKEPKGALYIMAKLPIADAEDFVKFMITEFEHNKKTALVTPAEDFYITPGMGKNEIRIAYVLNKEKLQEAMEVLAKGLEAFLSRHGQWPLAQW